MCVIFKIVSMKYQWVSVCGVLVPNYISSKIWITKLYAKINALLNMFGYYLFEVSYEIVRTIGCYIVTSPCRIVKDTEQYDTFCC